MEHKRREMKEINNELITILKYTFVKVKDAYDSTVMLVSLAH